MDEQKRLNKKNPWMKQFLSGVSLVGAHANNSIIQLGALSGFFVSILQASLICLRRPSLVIREIYFIGVLSLVIILVSGFFVGMVLSLQMYTTLERFGSGESVGMVVALSLVRELGPVLSAILFSSRAGSSITAEIGLMKTTEQLNALEMMAIPPIARVIVPRFWAGVLSLPLLTAIFNVSGIFGGHLVAVNLLGVDLVLHPVITWTVD